MSWVEVGSVVVAALAVVVSAAVAVTLARAQQATARLELAYQRQTDYLTGLHAERLRAYQQLFGVLEPFALDGRDPPSPGQLDEVARGITAWYYATGGLLVSEDLRDRVLDFRHRLRRHATDGLEPSQAQIRSEREAAEQLAKQKLALRQHASDLRSTLIEEVLSRQLPAPGAGPTLPDGGQRGLRRRRVGAAAIAAVGLGILAFSLYNLFYVPSIDPQDPERGWAWLTFDAETIAYIKASFRMQGSWQLAVATFALAGAAGLASGSRWAWWGLWSVPLALVLVSALAPWTAPAMAGPVVVSVVALAATRRTLG